jgi:hypothetical protein
MKNKIETPVASKCITTYSGIEMNVFDPTPDMIDIKDIAHALSNVCRFGGHCRNFYSVAQHSIYCYELADYECDKLGALMHDASEAYLYDFPKPIKEGLEFYKSLENNLMIVISKKFGFEFPILPEIKSIEKELFKIEWDNLMNKNSLSSHILKCWNPKKSEKMFLNAFNCLK